MKARFIKTSETFHDLGIEFVPETKDEELLIEMYTRHAESTEFELSFNGWASGGSQRFPDGQEQFTRSVRAVIRKKQP